MKLQIENLSYTYQSSPILKDLSFEAQSGDFISVIGPNGAGKSTLFRCILNFLPDYSGAIRLDGRNTKEISPRELSSCISYIPQIHRPTFGYSVLDTVLMGMAGRIAVFSKPGPSEIREAEQALDKMGVLRLKERDFARLSGGEQQLVLIARAIAQKAQILIMDEPTSALDYGNQYRVLGQIRELSEQGYLVLFSTHHPQQALQFSTGVLALKKGMPALQGAPEEILTPGLIRELYGIDAEFFATPSGTVILPKR
ncbi:MAG: ABC transporter ATP-binding protein [Lachnospiraceae bacterium]|nr:ABC transporter ATP-binding protein [Lachnospiraceae bacterium]